MTRVEDQKCNSPFLTLNRLAQEQGFKAVLDNPDLRLEDTPDFGPDTVLLVQGLARFLPDQLIQFLQAPVVAEIRVNSDLGGNHDYSARFSPKLSSQDRRKLIGVIETFKTATSSRIQVLS